MLVFASVRKLYGRAAAVVFLLIMSVFAVFSFNYNQITPKLLLLAAAGVVFITIKANIAESSIRCMLTGILTGMAFRLDLTVLMLWFVLIVFVLSLILLALQLSKLYRAYSDEGAPRKSARSIPLNRTAYSMLEGLLSPPSLCSLALFLISAIIFLI